MTLREKKAGKSPEKVLISCGPMRTYLDPVRYIQNESTGKMGLALALEAKARGMEVSVLLGPVENSIKKDFSVFSTIISYKNPLEYRKGLETLFPKCDWFFSASAVLDFECLAESKKIERNALENTLTLPIQKTEDFVLKMTSQKRPDQKIVAFAAECGTEEEICRRAFLKLQIKDADFMLANPVTAELGPGSEYNMFWVFDKRGLIERIGPELKTTLAKKTLDLLFAIVL
jgi:phosphopantothenoylcysteine decarboxylase/phosphopantothenate--cysteine ligase